jgi:hypothetical protein
MHGISTAAAVVITTWRFDGHGDRDTVGHIAAEVADARAATLLAMPIWAWHTPPCALALQPKLLSSWLRDSEVFFVTDAASIIRT